MKSVYSVNIAKIDGGGDFPCPVCKAPISPEDMDEKTYKVIEVKSKQGILNEILIKCNKCRSAINLVGFENLNEPVEDESSSKPIKPKKGKTDKLILELLADGSSLTLIEISERLDKSTKVVFKALRKLFQKEKISNNPKQRTYSIKKQ